MEELNAITRKEKFLAKAAGQDVEVPEPITREEMFLSKIAGGGGGSGGGGGLPVVELSQETIGSIFTSGRAELTTAEAKFFVDAFTALTPVVVKGNFNGIKFSGVSNIYVGTEAEGFENYFLADTGNGKFEIRAGVADGEYIGSATIKLG